MATATHTPGPWNAVGDVVYTSSLGDQNSTRDIVANVFASRGGSKEANAHLAASAPDILKVMKDIIFWAQSRCPCHEETPNPCPLCGASVENLEACKAVESVFPRELLLRSREAISKAEGRS